MVRTIPSLLDDRSNAYTFNVIGPFHSSFQQDMYPENHPSEYRSIAINPSFYPRAASLARQRSQSPIPMPHGAATRDRNGKDWVHDRYNGPINVGSQGGPTLGQTWTSQLSAECQKRHFNPQFKEWINSDGTFQCSVELRGITLNDSRTWRSAVDAKQALARRAVEHIRKTPVIGVSNRERERAQVKAEEKARSQTKSQTVAAEQEEERRLLTKVQRLYGTGPGPSENILGNPVASRAFLEGFALGSKLRDSVRNQRRRSRSPPHSDRGRDRRGSYDGYIKRE